MFRLNNVSYLLLLALKLRLGSFLLQFRCDGSFDVLCCQLRVHLTRCFLRLVLLRDLFALYLNSLRSQIT
jgi:hypothetical protein